MFVEKRPIVVPLPVHVREVELAISVVAIDIQETTVAVLVGEDGRIVRRAIRATAVRFSKRLNFIWSIIALQRRAPEYLYFCVKQSVLSRASRNRRVLALSLSRIRLREAVTARTTPTIIFHYSKRFGEIKEPKTLKHQGFKGKDKELKALSPLRETPNRRPTSRTRT